MPGVFIVPENNGPYHVQGPVTIMTEGGRVIEVIEGETWLCRCGHSSTKPFCDGTHERIGFSSHLDAELEAAEAAAPAADGYEDVCAEGDIPEGAIKGVRVGGVPVVIGRVGGQMHAIGGVCSHQQALLEGGELEGQIVLCPLHESGFDITTGRPVQLPATEPVPSYDVRVEAGRVLVARRPR